MAKVKLKELFEIEAPDSVFVNTWDDLAGPVPKKEHHIFEPLLLKVLLMWLTPVTPRRNMLLIGGAGTGKTSAFTQLAARMSIPLWTISCSGKTRFEHLIGSMQLRDGNTVWQDGPLLSAWRNGGIFLANELTRMDSGEQMRLVDAMDKHGRITVGETGEVVYMHDRFRFAATGNSGGFGDESGAYVGEKVSSFAFMDRFIVDEVKPLSEEDEIKLVSSVAPTLPADLIRGMVSLARTVRDSFVGNGGSLRITISPRALCDWAATAVHVQRMTNTEPGRKALELIVLNGKPTEDRQVVLELYDKWIKGGNAAS